MCINDCLIVIINIVFRLKEEKYWILLSKKISGEASPEELNQLNKLIESNPEWLVTLENLQELWDSKPDPANISAIRNQKAEDAYLSHVIRLKDKSADFEEGMQGFGEERSHNSDKKKSYLKIAAYLMAAFLLTGGLFFYQKFQTVSGQPELQSSLKESGPNEINVAKGSKSLIKLPDGSQVWINSGSKITYSKLFSSETRELTLDGEAYFDVVKDPRHPFIVHTSGIDVKVLGTAFNIRCYPDEKNIEASLVRGSLEVTIKDWKEKIILKPNEKLTVHNNTASDTPVSAKEEDARNDEEQKKVIELGRLSVLPKDSTIIETSWVYNKLVFRSETFEEVARKMERWYAVNISFKDEKIKEKKLTGIFENETVSQALDAIQMTTKFSYTIDNNKITISK